MHTGGGRRVDNPDRSTRRARSRRPFVTVLEVATACVVGSAAVAWIAGSGGVGDIASRSAPTADATSAITACGTATPFEFRVPVGYGRVQATSSPDAESPAAPGQLVAFYPSSSGSVELRWPAEDFQKWEASLLEGGSSDMLAATLRATTTKLGETARRTIFLMPSQVEGCRTLQVTVYDSNVKRAAAVTDAITTHPVVSHVALVTSTATAFVPPGVAPCVHPDSTAEEARSVTAVSSPTVADPRAALAAFVATNHQIAENGYTEVQLPDGSLVYTSANRLGAVVVEVHVIKGSDGWTVADTTQSPC